VPSLKLTRRKIDAIPFFKPTPGSKKNQEFYRDPVLPGFGLKVTKTSKLFIVEKRINGILHRPTIGKYPQLTPEQAREIAQETLYKLAKGIDITTGRSADSVTLDRCFADFLNTRTLKDRTSREYIRFMGKYLKDWRRKRIVSISRDMVSHRHKKIGATAGHAQANIVMRFLRSLMNFASGQYDDGEGGKLIKENPVSRLSETKQWFPVSRRRTIIKSHQLPQWYEAVMNLKNDTIRDYILLLFFTGLRREEGFKLKWSDMDMKSKTFVVTDTKNKTPLQLPFGNHIFRLLKKRKEQAGEGEYVFPGKGKSGHLVEPKKQVAQVTKESGVQFCLHDLRRGFITTAESQNVPSYSVKTLVNHSTGSDVTGGYIISDPERLRKPMQRIENHLLGLCLPKPSKIVELPR
jgi:integrase